jgi:shikimate kinase
MIYLIGPGGAGKSTIGAIVAERLNISFVDLDTRLTKDVGDISAYIDQHGYDAYARANVAACSSMVMGDPHPGVIALSSGFMTYATDVHPEYLRVRGKIEQSPTTVVLLPSTDLETCVAETVRRQVGRVFGRSAGREEAVIRERFALYFAIRLPKIETMRPPVEVADEIIATIAP